MAVENEVKSEGTTTAEEILNLHDALQKEFVKSLWAPEGAKALEHLRTERGLADDAIRKFGLGYVKSGNNSMRDLVILLGASLETAADAGILKRDSRKTKDSFRKSQKRDPDNSLELSGYFAARCKEDKFFYRDYHCIVGDDPSKGAMFGDWLVIPIMTKTEDKVRIGGFQLRSARPKEEIGKQGRYRNPVNTVAMTWNETLIGLAEEEETMITTGEAVICEGGFDRFATICALESRPGPRCAVIALGGIAVRGGKGEDTSPEERAGILTRIKVRRATLLLDQDEKGTEAILTVGPRLAALNQIVTVARIEDGWDPKMGETPKDAGELFSKAGPQALLAAIDAGRKRGLITYAASEEEKKLQASAKGARCWERLAALDVLIPVLSAIPEQTRQKATARVASVTGLPEECVATLSGSPPNEAETPKQQATRQ